MQNERSNPRHSELADTFWAPGLKYTSAECSHFGALCIGLLHAKRYRDPDHLTAEENVILNITESVELLELKNTVQDTLDLHPFWS